MMMLTPSSSARIASGHPERARRSPFDLRAAPRPPRAAHETGRRLCPSRRRRQIIVTAPQ